MLLTKKSEIVVTSLSDLATTLVIALAAEGGLVLVSGLLCNIEG